jgi:hypothetical protein
MTQSNLIKTTLIGLFTLILSSLSVSTFAAASSITSSTAQTQIETQNTNWLDGIKQGVKQGFKSLKKVTTKKARQLRKEYHGRNSFQKVAWGIIMILGGVFVTLGSILTLSGWGFVIGLGLIVWGALKIVVGVLGVVF